MKKSFKHSVKEYLASVSLNNKQFQQLMLMQERYTYKPVRRRRRKVFPWLWIVGFATLCFIGVVVTTTDFFDNRSLQPPLSSSLIQRIANEVATNHLKMRPLEVRATGIMDVQNYFTRLNFLPYSARSLAKYTRMKLVGGRYGSIQSAKAAQLRYKNIKGDYVNLFETAYRAELFDELPDVDKGEEPVVTYTKGIKVSMWVEKKIVMVSTEKFR